MLTRLNVPKVVQHHSVSTLKFMHENVSKTFWAALLKHNYSTDTDINKSVLDKSPFSELHCDVLVVGGGSGGCTIASKFVNKLGKNKVIIIEPRDSHYYQPMYTLIGAGIKKTSDSEYAMSAVLPSGATWLKDRADRFEPESNVVYTKNGSAIHYKYLVVACGLILHYDKIKGVPEALAMEDSGVCSNYTPEYAEKTFKILQNLKEGNAVFNFPTGPIKCAGAPLKACFLSEHYIRLNNRRNNINFFFNTSLPTVFAVKYYAEPLHKLFVKKNINLNFRRDLVLVKPDLKEATFRLLDKTFELETINYSMLHVTPPMSTPPELKSAKNLVDKSGFLNVEISTLQHVKYKNIFGLGDCTNLPTSKTAAAVASQAKVVYKNISNLMEGKEMLSFYNGYSSCPLVTGFGTCVLAEFDYEHNPLETLPVDQRKERAVTYYLKRDIFPRLYWLCLKGFWNGPETVRKVLHLGGIIKQNKVGY